jgi:hypothetical protein
MDVLIKKRIQKKKLLQAKKKVKLEKEKKLQKKMFEDIEQERELARGKEREKEVNKFEILKYYRDEYPEASATELKKIIKTETGVDIPSFNIVQEQPSEKKQELIEKKLERDEARLKELDKKKKEEQNALKQELQRQQEKEEMAKTKKSRQDALDEIERIKTELKNIPKKYQDEKRNYDIAIKKYQEQLGEASAKKQRGIGEELSFKKTREKNIGEFNKDLEERTKQAKEYEKKISDNNDKKVSLEANLEKQKKLIETIMNERVKKKDQTYRKKDLNEAKQSVKEIEGKLKLVVPTPADVQRNKQNLQAMETLIRNIETEKTILPVRSRGLINEAQKIIDEIGAQPVEPQAPKQEDIDKLEQRIKELQGEAKMPEKELPMAEASDADLGIPSVDEFGGTPQLGDLNYDYKNDKNLSIREKGLIMATLITPMSAEDKQNQINRILDSGAYSQMNQQLEDETKKKQQDKPITAQSAEAEVEEVPQVPVKGQVEGLGLKPTGKGIKFLQRYMVHPRDIKIQKGGQLKFTNRGKKHIKLLTKIHEPRRAGHIIGISVLNKLAKHKKKRVKAGGIFDTLGSIIGSIF